MYQVFHLGIHAWDEPSRNLICFILLNDMTMLLCCSLQFLPIFTYVFHDNNLNGFELFS
jgi:hypothetical protein